MSRKQKTILSAVIGAVLAVCLIFGIAGHAGASSRRQTTTRTVTAAERTAAESTADGTTTRPPSETRTESAEETAETTTEETEESEAESESAADEAAAETESEEQTEPETEAEPETEIQETEAEAAAPESEQPEETEAATVSENTSDYPLIYSDGSLSINVSREWYAGTWCYIAHVVTSDYSRIGTVCANYSYGSSQTTSSAAQMLGSILTVNGDYASPNLGYIVVRSGQLVNGSGRACWLPAVYSRVTGRLLNAWEAGGTPGVAGASVDSLVSDGTLTDSFSFGPPILTNGSPTGSSDSSRAQRTFIGTNGAPGDMYIVVSDGRGNDGESAGLTYTECAQLLAGKGCSFGIPLDGGGSSTMVFEGRVLNAAAGNERAVVDFLYVR